MDEEILELLEIIVSNFTESETNSKHHDHLLYFLEHVWTSVYRR